MSGTPTNRATGNVQHFSISGVSTQLIREMRVYTILENRSMGELVSEAMRMYLDAKKRNAEKR